MKYNRLFSVFAISAVMATSVVSVYGDETATQATTEETAVSAPATAETTATTPTTETVVTAPMTVTANEPATTAPATGTTAATTTDTVVKVYLNDELIDFGATDYACIMNNRTMVPIRATATALGMGIEWDGSTNTMTFTRGEDVITHVMGTNVLTINGEPKTYEAYSAVKNNYTYMPLIMLADVTGLDPVWDAVTKSVYLEAEKTDEEVEDEEVTDEEIEDEENEDDEEEEVTTKKKVSRNSIFGDDITMLKYLSVTYDTGKDMDGGKGQNYIFNRQGGGYVVANLHNELYVRELDKDLNVVNSNRFYTDDYEIGGYFYYNNCHYVLYGRDNSDRVGKTIVYKLVKYDTNFNSVKNVTVSGTNCRIDTPFTKGRTQMILNGKTLTVSDTGLRLPENNSSLDCNIVMSFNIDDLTFLGYDITSEDNKDIAAKKNSGMGQLITYISDNSIACAALSDARPRGLYLRAEEIGSENEDPSVITVLKADNSALDKDLGIDLGGFEVSDNYCIVTGTSVEQSKTSNSKKKNVFVATASKSEFNEKYTSLYWLTDYTDDDDVTILYQKLVKVSDNLFLIMWQENRDGEASVIKYGYLDGEGKVVEGLKRADKDGFITVNGKLSSAQPLLASDKKSIYYTMTEADGDPIELYEMVIDVPERSTKKGK
jgi:hypothetical protein